MLFFNCVISEDFVLKKVTKNLAKNCDFFDYLICRQSIIIISIIIDGA